MRLIRQAGDTIIEVMLAFTVFALLAVGAITIMNQGVASAQEALETTLVRQQIDGQAETLRFLHQAYMINPQADTGAGARFKTLLPPVSDTSNASEYGDARCLDEVMGNSPFALNPRTAAVIKTANLHPMNDTEANPPAYSQLVFNSDNSAVPYGLWIEAVNGDATSSQPKFVDFHIRACWFSVTNDAPRTLGTIVRLYYAS